jgi:hypothetical protein
MSETYDSGGKRPGKTEWAGRRRPMTRRAGFTSHPESSGGEFKVARVGGFALSPGKAVRVKFQLPVVERGRIVGFGAWYAASPGVDVDVAGCPAKYRLSDPDAPNWSCVGSQWYSEGSEHGAITLTFTAFEDPAEVALWAADAGAVSHEYLEQARPELMRNMHDFAPEANFYSAGEPGTSRLNGTRAWGKSMK